MTSTRNSGLEGRSLVDAHVRQGRQMRQPRLAEIVAAKLRQRIVAGSLTEGDELPRQDDLLKEFTVSPPVVREAMRILETEGLITVRRGNTGGAVVHLPTTERVSYMISLVLQSQTTDLGDVGAALRLLEPQCAVLCAAREDRATEIVPVLRSIAEEQAQMIPDDLAGYARASKRFHDEIVSRCGSSTLILVVGALEAIWSVHAREIYEDQKTVPPKLAAWKASLKEHQEIVDAIEAGDQAVGASVASHLEASQTYTLGTREDNRTVNASLFS